MDTLRECVVVLRLLTRQQIMCIHVGTGGIDQRPSADLEFGPVDDVASTRNPPLPFAPRTERLDIVGSDATPVQCGSYEVEDETRVIVVQIRIGILEAAGGVVGVEDRFLLADGGRRGESGRA